MEEEENAVVHLARLLSSKPVRCSADFKTLACSAWSEMVDQRICRCPLSFRSVHILIPHTAHLLDFLSFPCSHRDQRSRSIEHHGPPRRNRSVSRDTQGMEESILTSPPDRSDDEAQQQLTKSRQASPRQVSFLDDNDDDEEERLEFEPHVIEPWRHRIGSSTNLTDEVGSDGEVFYLHI